MRNGKYIGIFRALAILAAATPGAALAGSAIGVWETEPMGKGGYAHVRIAPCAGGSERLCGRIERIISSGRTDLVGVELLRDMAPAGADRWGDGDIYSPDRDRYYSSNMVLTGDGLEVRGCIAALCRSQKWARVE